MILKLRGYLATLDDMEKARPEGQRRQIPTITELAREVGLSRVQMQRIVGGNTESIKLDVAGNIIRVLRRRGFPMEVTDLIDFVGE